MGRHNRNRKNFYKYKKYLHWVYLISSGYFTKLTREYSKQILNIKLIIIRFSPLPLFMRKSATKQPAAVMLFFLADVKKAGSNESPPAMFHYFLYNIKYERNPRIREKTSQTRIFCLNTANDNCMGKVGLLWMLGSTLHSGTFSL